MYYWHYIHKIHVLFGPIIFISNSKRQRKCYSTFNSRSEEFHIWAKKNLCFEPLFWFELCVQVVRKQKGDCLCYYKYKLEYKSKSKEFWTTCGQRPGSLAWALVCVNPAEAAEEEAQRKPSGCDSTQAFQQQGGATAEQQKSSSLTLPASESRPLWKSSVDIRRPRKSWRAGTQWMQSSSSW